MTIWWLLKNAGKEMKFIKILLILLFCTSLLFSQDKGVIRGLITDGETGDPLIGANILVKGTYLGSSTDADGFYSIRDVSPGEYLLEVSFIGYKVVQKTGVKVTAGETLTLNFEMEPTALALGQEIVVIGEKPLLSLDETSTVRNMSSQDIENRIVDDAMDLIGQQVGVVQQDNEIHIRGGRAYENQFLLDGISVQDPLSGTGFGLNISANALEEVNVITGGYKAEYGQATSGVINVKTKSGGDRYSGYFSYKSDNLGLFRNQDFSFNTDIYEFNLGGPEPLTNGALPQIGLKIPGKLYFFLNFYTLISDDYTGSTANRLYSSITPRIDLFGNNLFGGTTFAPRQDNNWSGLFKLTWKMSPTHTLTYSYNRSLLVNQNTQSLQTNLAYVEPSPGFPYEYSKILDNFNTFTHDNEQASLDWQQALSKTTFYELKVSRYFAHLRSDWNGELWNEYLQAVDVPRLPVTFFYPEGKVRVIPGDGFFDYGNSDNWHDHYAESYTLKGDITSKIGGNHTFKGGFETNFREMQLIDFQDPYYGDYGAAQEIYKVHPGDGALYIQDDINFEGLYLNLGVRMDYWAPGALVDRAIEDTSNAILPSMREKYREDTFEIFGHRVKTRLMPRVGVSFPISNNQMLYFNYGHFSKIPKPQFVYSKLGASATENAYPKFGNPSLNPETSVKYELGIRNKFTENDVVSVTAFYKDIFDYVQTRSLSGVGPRGAGSALFYVNLDYARSRGIEAEYKTRIGKYFYGDISGTYSITTTQSSSPDVGFLVASAQVDERPVKETFARWDRPWQVSANLALRVPRGERFSVFGLRLFNNWNLNLRFFAQAGKRYTPVELTGFGPDGRPLYSTVSDVTKEWNEIATIWKWVDLSFTKYFDILGFKYAFYLEIKNLLDNQNAQIINPVTGDAYQYGDDVPRSWNDPRYPDRDYPISDPFPLNPARYRAPRNIRFGISFEF